MLLGLPKFEYVSCKTLEEACSLLLKHEGESAVLAGGTDLLVKMKHRKLLPRYLVNIKRIPDLGDIRYDDLQGVRIGALTTIQTIRNSALIMKKFSVLNQASGILGTPHVRNLATLGGNICNASPASECAPPLLTLEARARIVGTSGERTVPLEELFVGPSQNALRSGEILTEIQIPSLPPRAVGVHLKHSTRRVDVAIANVSVVIMIEGNTCQDIRIALGAVGPVPFRGKKTEAVLRGQRLDKGFDALLEHAAQQASDESFPIDDIRGPAAYRKQVVKSLVRQGIERAIAQARS
jgi:CO/xanthine dehydrogenase FAD-binding subunit